jgi:hypothetical protein
MKKILYYVAESTYYDYVGSADWKVIAVYEIIDNQPMLFAEIEALSTASSEEEIQEYLDNNGYGDEEYEFVRL